MNLWNWLSLLGIPAIVASVVVALWVQTLAIKRGVQALLRDRLTHGYKFHEKEGWADIDDRNNLENIYVQYHNLGQNGVMDDLRKKFLALPTTKPKNKTNGGTAA
jgi:hypothetical protein